MIEIANSDLIKKTYFLCDIKTNKIIITCLQLKHLGVHLHGLDTRDTYTNSIINEFF